MSGFAPEDHVSTAEPGWDTPAAGTRQVPSTSRWRWWPALALLALATLAGTLVLQSRGSGDPSAGSYIRTPGVLSPVAPEQRAAGPRVRGELLDGVAFDSAAWAGDILVVNVWGSWCPPCRAETPELVTVANATRADGVRFLGIDIRDTRPNALAFNRRYQVPYPSIFDPDGRALLAFRGLPPNAVPTTFVLDRQGRIAARGIGRITGRQLTALLADLQREPSPSSAP